MDPVVVAAAIGAVPSTVAAAAALHQARKANRQVETNGSGKSLGMLVEDIAKEVRAMNTALLRHMTDERLHGR